MKKNLRSQMLAAAIKEAQERIEGIGKPLSPEEVFAACVKALPSDFDLQMDAEFMAALGATEPATADVTAPVKSADVPQTRPQARRDYSETEREAARVRLVEAESALHTRRRELNDAGAVTRQRRAELSKAVLEFQTGGKVMTREQLMREMIYQSQAQRAAGIVSRKTPPGPSVVDRFASYSAGGDGSDAVRKGFRNGGFRRGNVPIGTLAHMRARAVNRPKLPSDR